ncbi:MAG: sigma-70 family RNA polymerase sigma factor [Candidatus Brocadiae bacterium]|nr:sigma-70 family RNA polymerase sigma factor [Candidatus Brocadiia bacterium]
MSREVARRLYEEFMPAMFELAAAILGDHAAAEDAVSLVFTRILEAGDLLPRSPENYLLRAIRNACVDHLRRERTREKQLRNYAAEGASVNSDSPDVAEQRRLLDSAMGGLPVEKREILILHYRLGRTTGEIAEILSLPESTVASRLRHAVEELRKKLERVEQSK